MPLQHKEICQKTISDVNGDAYKLISSIKQSFYDIENELKDAMNNLSYLNNKYKEHLQFISYFEDNQVKRTGEIIVEKLQNEVNSGNKVKLSSFILHRKMYAIDGQVRDKIREKISCLQLKDFINMARKNQLQCADEIESYKDDSNKHYSVFVNVNDFLQMNNKKYDNYLEKCYERENKLGWNNEILGLSNF